MSKKEGDDHNAADVGKSGWNGRTAGLEADNVHSSAKARLGSHPSGLSRRNGVVGALSYPQTLERAWRNWGWPFWADD